jgi:hypothetical protein
MGKASLQAAKPHTLENGSLSETRMSNILIKYATRSRPQWFRKAIANIYDTTSDKDFRILVTLDDDDITMKNEGMIQFMKGHEQIKFIYGHSSSKVGAINRDMDLADEWYWKWDILVVMSDDMHFTQFGWDNIIRQRYKDNFPEGDAFLHFDDGYVKDALATMSIIDRKYYERDNYIYHPIYKSFSCDAEAFFVAKARGRHKYFPEIIARHQHPANMPMPNDELYSKNSLHTPHDTSAYWDRLHNNFDMGPGEWPWNKYKTR